MRYIRYADDFLLGFIGPKAEAEDIKTRLATFLGTPLHLTLAPEKTLVTHATTDRARFLGYEIGGLASDTKFDDERRRSINGRVALYSPKDVVETKRKRCLKEGKVMHRADLLHHREYDIVTLYPGESRGLGEYYGLALNLNSLNYLRWVRETSLLKTLASKSRPTVTQTARRLKGKRQTPNGPRPCLQVIVPREGKRPLVATCGGLSLQRRPHAKMQESVLVPYVNTRSEIVQRLLRDTCAVCGATGAVEIPHTRKLADLKRKGRKETPLWMQVMIALRRKTLALCREGPMNIHHNRQQSNDTGNRRAG